MLVEPLKSLLRPATSESKASASIAHAAAAGAVGCGGGLTIRAATTAAAAQEYIPLTGE